MKNQVPKFWDRQGPYFIQGISAAMLSFADHEAMPARMKEIELHGVHKALGLPHQYKVFLDNGAFSTMKNKREFDVRRFLRFAKGSAADWYPIPAEKVPHPSMSAAAQKKFLDFTASYNRRYARKGCVPVVHAGLHLAQAVKRLRRLYPPDAPPEFVGLGAMVPFLLRMKGAECRSQVVDDILLVRRLLPDTKIHGFGIGGTATLHLAALLGLDSVDSSGWRNRAARGIVQLLGRGDRVVADFGRWRGRRLSPAERQSLNDCGCPACVRGGAKALEEGGIDGFGARATHNLWVLVEELSEIDRRLARPGYLDWVRSHVENRLFLPLIERAATLHDAALVAAANSDSKTVCENRGRGSLSQKLRS